MIKVFEKISYKQFELSMENLECLCNYKLHLQTIRQKRLMACGLYQSGSDNFEFKLEDFVGYRLEVQYEELEFVEYDKCVCNDVLGTFEYFKDGKLVKFEQRYEQCLYVLQALFIFSVCKGYFQKVTYGI